MNIKIFVTSNTLGRPPEFGEVQSIHTRKVADAHIVIEGGLLDGLRIDGFTLWENIKSERITVMCPNRMLWRRPNDYVATVYPAWMGAHPDNFARPDAKLETAIVDEYLKLKE